VKVSQIRTMFRDTAFTGTMDVKEKNAWLSFKAVAENFLGNKKSPHYKKLVAEMISNFEKGNLDAT